MATTFALGAESNRLPACLYVCLFVTLLQKSILLLCFLMESSHFLTISCPWEKLQNVVLRIFFGCHGNKIWATFAKNSHCFFFFVLLWNRAIFWSLVLRDPLYKTFFFDFWFRPPNTQNWLPKIWPKTPITRLVWQVVQRCLRQIGGFRGRPIEWNHTKCCRADPCCHGNEIWAITRLVWQIDRRCLHLPWGFRGWRIQWNHAKCCGAEPCCHGNEIWANLGYFSTKSPMSHLVCQIDQICLGLPAETNSGADLCCQGNDIWDRRGV